MNEVSCKVFAILLAPLEEKGVPLDRIVEGTSITAEQLRDRKHRIDWTEYVAIMRNVRPHFTDDEYVELGRVWMRSPGLRFAFVIARLLFSAMDFYRWMNKPREGVGNQMFSCIIPSHRELSENEIELDLTLPEGFEVCWDFYVISSGNMEELPRLLGLPPAKVSLTRIPRGGRFHITVPLRTPLFARIWRALSWPFTARSAARELKAAHETLLERYEELEATRGKLADYQANLEKLVEERTAELRQARDELSDTVVQLRAAQGARERFFGNISHEIRTPLSLILLAVADIEARTRDQLDARAKAGLASVGDAARKLVRLVDELLLLAAGQEDKLQIRPEPIDLAVLMTNLLAAWLPAAEAAGLSVSSAIPATLVARVDPVALERVASNLVSNAVKYTPRGGHVRIELAREDGIRMSVLDDGPGIPDELAERLFGRFERGEDRRKVGSGIGLSLVKQLVDAHGGSVTALAREGGGTEFRVVLPKHSLVDQHAPAPALTLDVVAPATLASGQVFAPAGVAQGTLVLAEDDTALAEVIARRLGETYKVIVALDGEAAVDAIATHQPQLLVTDVDMPKLNGIELSRRFRAMTADKLAPIIILSAVLDVGTRVAGLEAGAVDYVTKPIDPIELDARVSAQFRMRDMSMRLHRAEQLSALGVLTAGLAHELRNPANGIVNAVEPLLHLLPAELRTPESATGQLLEVMVDCSQHIAHLSRQLLGFKNGGTKLDLQPARTRDLVDRAVSLARSALNGVDMRVSGMALDRDVMCAPPLLVQVLTNLIENAGHAAGTGGWVEVCATHKDGGVTIEVADSGPGVPRELRERVFEPFFTTKAPGAGTGLGLSVARSIVHRHQGVLEIRERADRAVFVIELPGEAQRLSAN